MIARLLALFLAVTSLAQADTPDAILKDYRTRATEATRRLDETLEKQGAQIVTNLVRSGDTAGAETVTTQLKILAAGESVNAPHSAAAKLFAQYTGARTAALKPVQSAALTRLDSLLKVAGGPKLDELQALTKARAEIESGLVTDPNAIPVEWTYHGTPTSTTNIATVKFQPDGTWQMTEATGQTTTGQWKSNAKGDKITIQLADAVWKATIEGNIATVDRPDVGTRYLRVKGAPVGK